MWLRQCLGLVLVSVIGCSDKSVAPVSGRVTLDGEPLSGATVTFVPLGSVGNQNPGPSASATTDAEGRFALRTADESRGAVVGPCKIMISTFVMDEDLEDGTGVPFNKLITSRERVPAKYNSKTTLEFTVPPGGTKEANFDLQSR